MRVGLVSRRQCGAMAMQHIDVRGVATEEYVIPGVALASPAAAGSTSGAAVRWTAVVVPGNPGSARYYVPFAHALHKHMGMRVDVRVVSLAGHSLPPPPPAPTDASTLAAVQSRVSRVYVLHEQVAHVGAYLAQLSAQLKARDADAGTSAVQHRFVLFGHSIGAYIGLHATVARCGGPLGVDDVAQVVCMFPFVRFDLSRVQNALFRLLFLIRPLALLFIRFARLLPMGARRALVRLFTDIRAEFALHATTRVFFEPHLVRNGLTLGEDEFNTVPRAFDVSLYRAYAHKLTFFYTQLHDHWAPVAQYHQLHALLKDTPAQFALVANGVRHAFVVYPDQYTHMAVRCGDRMLQLIADVEGSTPAAAGRAAAGAGACAGTRADVSVSVAPATAHKSAL